jgi:hypothetical protein
MKESRRVDSSFPSRRPLSDVFSFLILGLVALAILTGLSRATHAAPSGRFVCAAKVDCGAPALPSTQDLPAENTPTVKSANADAARDACFTRFQSSYARLAKSFESREPAGLFRAAKGCRIVSEVFPN